MMMDTVRRILWGSIVILVLLLAAGILYWFSGQSPAPGTPAQQQPSGMGGSYPVTVTVSPGGTGAPGTEGTATTTSTGGQPTGTTQTMTLNGNGNATVTVADFTQDPSVQTDATYPGVYIIAGGMQPNPQSTPYSIVYYNDSQSFAVTLLQEPLGSNRHLAEQELQQKLGIGLEGMCALNYYLGVPEWVNERYAGTNLGFSYCPGATQLP